jgi:ATP-grasp domain
MKNDNHPVILLSASRWYALSARLAMAFIRHGARVSAICPSGHPLKFVPGIESLYRYKGLNSLGALKAAILSAQPDIIVPCDDGVVLQLHALHEQEPSLRRLIEYSLGDAEAYPILDSRDRLLRVAAELGIRIPCTQAIDSEADLADWPDASAVLKADGSMGGEGTAIAHFPAEMISAYRRLAEPVTAFTALKRTVINSRPLSIWRWQRLGRPSITIQEFIPGPPANTMIACWRGEVLGSVTVEVLSSQGATGAATVVRLIRHEEIEEASRRLAQRLMLTGFYGLDFILRKRDGNAGSDAAYLIEVNPRCTQLGHLCLPDQGDLAGIFSAKLRGAMPPSADGIDHVIEGDIVAFFPQALLWNPRSPHLYSSHHDVPWEAPELVQELLREEWPHRRPAARFYHSIRKPVRPKEEKFEAALEIPVRKENRDSFSTLT